MSECIIKDENKKKQKEARDKARADALKANMARRKADKSPKNGAPTR